MVIHATGRWRQGAAAAVLLLAAASGASGAEPGDLPPAPPIGVASNFGVDHQPKALRLARRFPVRNMRDGLVWRFLEQEQGRYDFSNGRTEFPALMNRAATALTLMVHPANPVIEGGATVTSKDGIGAFVRYAEAAAAAYPDIEAIEISNEFNSQSFVTGSVRHMTPLQRADLHVKYLAALSPRLRQAHPGIRIIGGAAHSIPAGYLWRILDGGGARWMDSLSVHPYTTEPEQFRRQIEVLRRHPQMAGLGIDVTEFGTLDRAAAPGYMLRYYCQMALAGVERAAWYPMVPRGGNAALFTRSGQLEPVGRTYRMIQEELQGRTVADAGTAPFTYGCAFDGGRRWVLWGAPRQVALAAVDITVQRADTTLVAPGTALRLSRNEPLIFSAARPLQAGRDILLGETRLIADSFDQFHYPAAGKGAQDAPGFGRLIRVSGGRELPLQTRPGQEAPGKPWTPYLGSSTAQDLRLGAKGLQLGGSRQQNIELIHRYRAAGDQLVDLSADLDILTVSGNGVELTVLRGGEVLHRQLVTERARIRLTAVALAAGQVLDLVTGPNGSARGDAVRHRFRLYRSAAQPE